MKLNDKVAIITGSAGGIGEAVAMRMAEEGAKIVIVDVQTEKGIAVEKRIKIRGGDAMFVQCDISSSDQVKAMVDQTIKHYRKIDILHNNAAIDLQCPFIEMDEVSWQRILGINLTGAFHCTRQVTPHMIKSGSGSIINTSSVQAFVGFPTYTAYAAAKGGIFSMTRQLAVELGPYHIRVNSVSPGVVDTPMTQDDLDNAKDPAGMLDEMNRLHALGRIAKSEEIANTVVFLASEEASFITGVDIKVDGGLSIKRA